MEMQKIVNFLNSSENEYSKFATTKNGTLLTVNQKALIQMKIQSNFSQVH